MARRSKKDKQEAQILRWLAENVEILRDLQYQYLPNPTARNKKLAQDADTTLSHIQRIIRQETAAGVDLIQRLALALDTRPQDLITPHYALRLKSAPHEALPAPGKQHPQVHEPATESYPAPAPGRSSARKRGT